LVVGKSWQNSLAALVCAAGISVESAQGSPVGMASGARQPAVPAPTASQPIPTTAQVAVAPASRSAWQRIADSMPNVRTPWGSKSRQVPPARAQNSMFSSAEPAVPATPELEISLAKLCDQRGDVAGARHHFQQALAKWPGHAEVLHEAALMEDRLGQFAVAERLYQQAVAANPADARALNDLGVCLGRQGKLDQSIQCIEQAIHRQPENARYRNNAATVLVELRQDQRAIGHLSAVHGAAEAQYNMGQLLVARSRASEAEHYFRAALAAKPDMQAASAAIAQLQGGQQQQPTSQPTTAPQVAQAPAAATSTTPPATPSQPTVSGPQLGPQMTYPSDATGTVYGRSAYTQPQYPVPPAIGGYGTVGSPQPSVPWVGQATPRPLPSVGAPAAGIRR
jgi:tetratricopeptide (TPR) repeat protein